MSDPLPVKSGSESVPPLSDKSSKTERESADEASQRARNSERISRVHADDVHPTTRACEAVDRFVHENPVVSVGLAFGLGLAIGAVFRLDDH